jgi:hypothetical protein
MSEAERPIVHDFMAMVAKKLSLQHKRTISADDLTINIEFQPSIVQAEPRIVLPWQRGN